MSGSSLFQPLKIQQPSKACELKLAVSAWRAANMKASLAQKPYPKETDFVLPSLKAQGMVPLPASIFVADHLRPAVSLLG